MITYVNVRVFTVTKWDDEADDEDDEDDEDDDSLFV